MILGLKACSIANISDSSQDGGILFGLVSVSGRYTRKPGSFPVCSHTWIKLTFSICPKNVFLIWPVADELPRGVESIINIFKLLADKGKFRGSEFSEDNQSFLCTNCVEPSLMANFFPTLASTFCIDDWFPWGKVYKLFPGPLLATRNWAFTNKISLSNHGN